MSAWVSYRLVVGTHAVEGGTFNGLVFVFVYLCV